MVRSMLRGGAIAAFAVPVVLLSSGVASAAPTVSVVGNADLTITVTPVPDSKGLRECKFEVKNSADKKSGEYKGKYKDGDPIVPVVFGPLPADTYKVKWECEDGDKKEFKETVTVTLTEPTNPGPGDPGNPGDPGTPGTGSADGTPLDGILSFLSGLSQS